MSIASTTKITDEDLVVIQNVIKATGMSYEEAIQLLKLDQELDDSCDAALSDLNFPLEVDAAKA